jgi:hypothetical protein
MISQIPYGAHGLEQLVGDDTTLRSSAMVAEVGRHRFVAQMTDHTGESSERAAPKELLSTLDLEGVLI